MTSKRSKEHSEAIDKAIADRAAAATTTALASLDAERAVVRARSKDGRYVGCSNEDLNVALLRIAAGDTMRAVTETLGITRSALLVRANADPDFRARLTDAQVMGAFSAAENTFSIARGDPGFTTGSIERDKLLVDVHWKWAKTIGNRIFGEKLAIDHRQIVMNFTSDDEDMI